MTAVRAYSNKYYSSTLSGALYTIRDKYRANVLTVHVPYEVTLIPLYNYNIVGPRRLVVPAAVLPASRRARHRLCQTKRLFSEPPNFLTKKDRVTAVHAFVAPVSIPKIKMSDTSSLKSLGVTHKAQKVENRNA